MNENGYEVYENQTHSINFRTNNSFIYSRTVQDESLLVDKLKSLAAEIMETLVKHGSAKQSLFLFRIHSSENKKYSAEMRKHEEIGQTQYEPKTWFL
jgi:hypothetical protein